MNLAGHLQTLLDEIQITLGCLDTFLRLLLEGMQNVDSTWQGQCVDSTVRVAVIIVSNLDNPAPENPFMGFASGCVPPF